MILWFSDMIIRKYLALGGISIPINSYAAIENGMIMLVTSVSEDRSNMGMLCR